MDKLLTISIAAYNMERYIGETLSSCVIDRKYMDDLEVLIINDGSTDKTVGVAQEYVQKYPNTFRIINKENGGYGTTVNMGIREAAGKYFKLLDGDDWYNKDALCKFMEILQTEESDLVITDYIIKYTTGKIAQKKVKCPYGKSLSLKNRMFYLPMHGSCYKTSILKANGIKLDRGILYTDNEYAIYPLFYVHSFSHYHLFVYEYRMGRSGQSIATKSYCKHMDDLRKVLDNLIAYYQGHEINNGAEMLIPYNISVCCESNISVFLKNKISKKMKQRMIKCEEEIEQANPLVYHMAAAGSFTLLMLRKSNYKLYYVLALYTHLKNLYKNV